jgi:Fe-S oxidoreductase
MVKRKLYPNTLDESEYLNFSKHDKINSIEELGKCINCGLCNNSSATYVLEKKEQKTHSSKIFIITNLNKNKNEILIQDSIFKTTSPVVAELTCPKKINHEDSFIELKSKTIMDLLQSKRFPKVNKALDNLKNEKYLNIYGISNQKRLTNFSKSDFKLSDYLFYPGSFNLFNNQKNTKKIIGLLTKFKIPFSLSKFDVDSGYIAQHLGDLSTAKFFEKKIINLIYDFNFKKIITTNPIEYNRLKKIFKDTNIEVYHIIEIISNKLKLINQTKIKRQKFNVSLLDSEYIAKYLGFDLSRKILENIGCNIVEFEHSKEEYFSIGAGTGFDLMYPELTKALGIQYIKEAIKNKVDYIITLNPNDEFKLNEIIENLKNEENNKIIYPKIENIENLVINAIKWSK